MRIYEELFIIKPDAPEEEVDTYIGQIKELITAGGGIIDKEEKWGVRRLAYRVLKYSEGLYILLQFQAGPDVVADTRLVSYLADLEPVVGPGLKALGGDGVPRHAGRELRGPGGDQAGRPCRLHEPIVDPVAQVHHEPIATLPSPGWSRAR